MKKILLAATVMLAAFAWSCKKQETVADAVTIKTDETVVSVEGGVVSIALNATVAWTAKSSQDWVTISPASGNAGDATIKASVLKNDTNDDRKAEITITAGTAKATYNLVQSQKDAVEVPTKEFTVAAEGGVVEIPVSSNVDLTVLIPESVDWIKQTEPNSKGMIDDIIYLMVDETHLYIQDPETGVIEEDAIARTAKVTITDGTLKQEVEISQKAFYPYFEYAGDWAGLQWSFYEGAPVIIPQEGADITIDINTNIDWRTYFSVWDNDKAEMVDSWDLGWAKLTYDDTHIFLKVEANDTYFARENYLYSVGMIDGEEDGNFGGLGWFRQEGKPLEGVSATFVWSKTLADLSIPAGYNRLAYKTSGGDALLISDGEKVHAISPADGSYFKALGWNNVRPASICSDDAGNVIVADHQSAASTNTYSVFYATNVDENPVLLFEHTNDFDGIEIGGWRVRGDIVNGAMITAIITMDGNSYWAGWEIQNKEVAYNNYYVQGTAGQNRGPLSIALGSSIYGAVMSLGANTNDGIVVRGYDGNNRDLLYLPTATDPNWITPYEWVDLATAGNGGNENPNNMAIGDYNGKRILAYTQGFHFNYSSDANIYVFDATDKSDIHPLVTIDPTQDIVFDDTFTWQSSADILLHATDSGLELYAINSGKGIIAKYLIVY